MKRLFAALAVFGCMITPCLANEPTLSINAGVEGNRFLVFVNGDASDDDIRIRLTDSYDDGQVEYLRAQIYDHGELVEDYVVPPSLAADIYIVARGWNGNDECEIDSDFIVNPELFTVYFEGGEDNDTFDGTGCVSKCIVRGGNGDDIIHGGWFGDDLAGGDGYDEIYGHAGADKLNGGYDDVEDYLDGGWGPDTFGKDIYKPVLNRSGTYVMTLVHTENYADFDADEDTISEVRYPMPRTSTRRRR